MYIIVVHNLYRTITVCSLDGRAFGKGMPCSGSAVSFHHCRMYIWGKWAAILILYWKRSKTLFLRIATPNKTGTFNTLYVPMVEPFPGNLTIDFVVRCIKKKSRPPSTMFEILLLKEYLTAEERPPKSPNDDNRLLANVFLRTTAHWEILPEAY